MMLRMISLSVVLLILSGCAKSDNVEEPTAGQVDVSAPWKSQVAAVRAGESTVLEFNSPVSLEEFNELKSGCEALSKLKCNVSHVDEVTLAEVISSLSKLKQLVLTEPQGNAPLEAVVKLPELQILNLSKSNVDDAGFALIQEHPSIELVRIESENLSDTGLVSIAKIPNLRFLHLINTGITDNGLKVLHPLADLESFYLDGSACTDEGLSEFVKAMPELHFHWNQLHLDDDPHGHSHE